MIPGEYILADGEIEANAGRRTVELVVANTGDRPIQVGSHFHFFEVEPGAAVRSRRWRSACGSTCPAGTAVAVRARRREARRCWSRSPARAWSCGPERAHRAAS